MRAGLAPFQNPVCTIPVRDRDQGRQNEDGPVNVVEKPVPARWQMADGAPMTDFLLLAFTFLVAGVIAVPVATRLGLGSVLILLRSAQLPTAFRSIFTKAVQ